MQSVPAAAAGDTEPGAHGGGTVGGNRALAGGYCRSRWILRERWNPFTRRCTRGTRASITLIDRLEEKRDAHEEVLNRLLLEELLEDLDGQERQLIRLRYFEERTQADIAARLGISQVQVSRMEKRILKRMRSQALRE